MMVFRLALMVLLQALILKDVAPFGDWTRPQWSLWALLLIPPQVNPFLKLLAGFGMGLGLDLAMGTYGQHMVAGTILGGFLPSLHRLMSPREGYEVSDRPTLRDLGSRWLLPFTFFAALVYHLSLMVVQEWYWNLMTGALFPAITSAFFTTTCCVIAHMVVYSPDRRKEGN